VASHSINVQKDSSGLQRACSNDFIAAAKQRHRELAIDGRIRSCFAGRPRLASGAARKGHGIPNIVASISPSPALTFKRSVLPAFYWTKSEWETDRTSQQRISTGIRNLHLHCRACRTPSAPGGGSTPTPAIDLVNLEPPASAESEARNFTALNQPVNGWLVAVKILGQVFYRCDFSGHIPAQHDVTSKQACPVLTREFLVLSQLKRGSNCDSETPSPVACLRNNRTRGTKYVPMINSVRLRFTFRQQISSARTANISGHKN